MDEHSYDVPFDYSPGLAEFLVKDKFTYNGFFATILRLDDKKAILLEIIGDRFFPKMRYDDNETPENISQSESVALDFLTEWRRKGGQSFTFDEIKKALSSGYKRFWVDYENALYGEFFSQKFINLNYFAVVERLARKIFQHLLAFPFVFLISVFMLFPALFILIILLLIFIFIFLPTLTYWELSSSDPNLTTLFVLYCPFIFIAIFTIAYFLLAIFGRKLAFKLSLKIASTDKIQEHRIKWDEFSQFIKDYSQIEREPVKYHALWGTYYTYALATGISSVEKKG